MLKASVEKRALKALDCRRRGTSTRPPALMLVERYCELTAESGHGRGTARVKSNAVF